MLILLGLPVSICLCSTVNHLAHWTLHTPPTAQRQPAKTPIPSVRRLPVSVPRSGCHLWSRDITAAHWAALCQNPNIHTAIIKCTHSKHQNWNSYLVRYTATDVLFYCFISVTVKKCMNKSKALHKIYIDFYVNFMQDLWHIIVWHLWVTDSRRGRKFSLSWRH